MILSDFGGPGAHFLMIFEYFGCLGTPFGGLEHILTQGSDFYDFGDLSAAKGYLVFSSFLSYFSHHVFCVFLSVRFFCFFVILGAQRLHFGRLFGFFLGALGHWKVKTKKCVWTAQACADCISSLPEK